MRERERERERGREEVEREGKKRWYNNNKDVE